MDPVPFIIYNSERAEKGVPSFNEETAKGTGLYLSKGEELLEIFINGKGVL
jgi:2,3-bisphosphoglycerate-independent phosphoglycerate mutase